MNDDSLEMTKDKTFSCKKRSFNNVITKNDDGVVVPITKKLKKSDIFNCKTGRPRHEFLKKHFIGKGKLEEEAALELIRRATDILREEANVIRIDGNVTICGDIHGQYHDLMKLLEIGGSPANMNYLFLGDYIDRGNFNIECVLYLWSLKICYPRSFYLLRGNHECRRLTKYFDFQKECKAKYSNAIYEACIESFECLPLVAIVNERLFCVHGGISPELETIQDIDNINRYREPESRGLMCDLLWSDPCENFGREEDEDLFFIDNKIRGCSYNYSYKACCNFLQKNHLISIVRAHEAMENGYKIYRNTTNGFPALVTLFSASNYMDVYENEGAIMRYVKGTIIFKEFQRSPRPNWLPNFNDTFTLPFMDENVTDVARSIIFNRCSNDELENEENVESRFQKIIGNRIKAVAKMVHNYLGEDKELVLQLKDLYGNKKSLRNKLQKKVTIDKFKRFDLLSEKESSVSFKNDELLLENFNQTQLHCNYKLNNHSKLISSEDSSSETRSLVIQRVNFKDVAKVVEPKPIV